MNDFPELENELRALRPARPSPVLFERIEEALAENCGRRGGRRMELAPAFHAKRAYRFGIGLATAAAAVVLATRADQHRSNAKRRQGNRTSCTCIRDKSRRSCLLGWERCRWIDVLKQIRSRWRDAGRL